MLQSDGGPVTLEASTLVLKSPESHHLAALTEIDK
jgi:hypothetical protein